MKTVAISHPSILFEAHGPSRSNEADSNAQFVAGGTSLVDLMKLDAATPSHLVSLRDVEDLSKTIEVDDEGISIGARASMADTAAHPEVRKHAPILSDALLKAASPQIRNMATMAGTLLQRTRCPYFRAAHEVCNKRKPGSGCAALGGETRSLAILGTSSSCIANYPGDAAVALLALDATVNTRRSDGSARHLPIDELIIEPGDTPDRETILEHGEVIASIRVPTSRWTHSHYVKVRDRASYAFAVASVGVAIAINSDEQITNARIALGGIGTTPWPCNDAASALIGQHLTKLDHWKIALLCIPDLELDSQRQFKVPLARRAVVKALVDVEQRISKS